MGILDKLFPRKGQEKPKQDEALTKETDKSEKKVSDSGQEDEYSLRGFDFKHPKKSLNEHLRVVKEGIYKGDKKAWHQFLMVSMISFAGICIIMIICINFCFELISLRYQLDEERNSKIIQRSAEKIYAMEKLPAGEYGIVHIFRSDGFYDDRKEKNNTVVMVANHKGGAVLLGVAPEGTEIPDEWLGPDSYNLLVDGEGKWAFEKSESFVERQETMKKARQEYMERMSGKLPQGEEPSGEAARP